MKEPTVQKPTDTILQLMVIIAEALWVSGILKNVGHSLGCFVLSRVTCSKFNIFYFFKITMLIIL